MSFLERQPHHFQVMVDKDTDRVTVSDWHGSSGKRRKNQYVNLEEGQDVTHESARVYDVFMGMSLTIGGIGGLFAIGEFINSKTLQYTPDHPYSLPALILAVFCFAGTFASDRKATDFHHINLALHGAAAKEENYYETTFRPK